MRRKRRSQSRAARYGVALVLATLAGHTAPAQEPTRTVTERDRAALDFVVGNVEYLLIHEIAHFLIAEKDLPILGPEENAADYIATLALLREQPLDPARQDRAVSFLVAAADAFASSWQSGVVRGAEIPYWGAHALGIQRYYQIACLLYGSDPLAFARLPDAAGLPRSRAETCVAEYERAARSIDWLLATYGRRPDDPPAPRIEVLYEPPPTRVSARIATELRSLELIERTLARLGERFSITAPVRVVLRGCGRSEAAWLPDRRELAICYDLLDTLYVLALERPGASLTEAHRAE